MDVVIKLQRMDEYTPEQGARFRVEFEKARNLHGPEVEPVSLMLKEKRYGRYVWEIIEEAPTKSEIERKEIFALKKKGKTQNQIADALGTSQSTVHRRLKHRHSVSA